MATRREHRTDIREQYGGFLTLSQIGKYMGIDPRTAKKYVEEHELKPTRICGRWMYDAIDIAKCIGR